MGNIITLTTDFGVKDHYAGTMKGVILSINPDAKIIDITHLVPSQNILAGAFAILQAYSFFPRGTIHIGVIDPDVGSKRKPILIETADYLFVGPDNGLFSLALEREKILRISHLTCKKYFLKEVSKTFHGRDIFAPVAAHLSLGAKPGFFGKSLNAPLHIIKMPNPIKDKDTVIGEVIYIDSFGNLITNIKAEDITPLKNKGNLEIIIGKIKINGISTCYSDGMNVTAIALIGSSNYLEIACCGDKASDVLQIKENEKIAVEINPA